MTTSTSMTSSLERNLLQVKQGMEEHEIGDQADLTNIEIINELIHKYQSNDCFIAFCGHFSAGKSSLINKLCGHSLLPSSPIPASANIVSIRYGEAKARVKQRKGEFFDVPLEQLETYCKNGEDIETVDIQYPVPFLKEPSFVLLDTPGVDSTDDNHMKATTSALHLADIVFYVMDYNHVQSEMNLKFAKKLISTGKPLYLIVNQIDKHREQEIPFKEYQQSIEKAFNDWGIQPAGFIYLSLKSPHHAHSQLDTLEWLFGEFASRHQDIRYSGITNAAYQSIHEHRGWIKQQHQDEKDRYIETLEQDDSQIKLAASKVVLIEKELDRLQTKPDIQQKSRRQELQSIIENANITPAIIRDLALDFLQSEKRGFKVGLLFSQKKTEEEKQKRQLSLIQALNEQIEAHLHWHIEDVIRQSDRSISVNAVHELPLFKVDLIFLQNQIHPGAILSEEYTLPYCKQLANEIKTYYRKKSNEWLAEYTKAILLQVEEEKAQLQNELIFWKEKQSALDQIKRLEAKEEQLEQSLLSMVTTGDQEASVHSIPLPSLSDAPRSNQNQQNQNKPYSDETLIEKELNLSKQSTKPTQGDSLFEAVLNNQLHAVVQKLEKAYPQIQSLPGMGTIAQDILLKKRRMENQTFTIALFGAFSAGKSSFANALIGEPVLPVSPNPTTAAVNRILPPTKQQRHGTASVQLKTEQTISDEVSYSLDILGFTFTNISAALHTIDSLNPSEIKGKGRPHYTFLKALSEGWGTMHSKLGQQLSVELEEFRMYAAQENRSCFVEGIDLYYSSPLTDQGIILVDTPGADSVNARHTGVAFNYIKNADAILFVTYYNHAFSRADQDFLLQLGRVKESFELDKMFFVVNAADLASSEEELGEVIGHIRSHLLKYEIRQPRIFPVSSIQALKGKQEQQSNVYENSGMKGFEKEFIDFISNDLISLSIQAAEHDLERAELLLQHLIRSMQSSRQEKEHRKDELIRAQKTCHEYLTALDGSTEQEALKKDIQERMYHVKQRIYFRLGEWYNAGFHPSLLQQDTGDIKAALMLAWKDFISSIEYNISQEAFAITLKAEVTVNQLIRNRVEQNMNWIQQTLLDCTFSSYEPCSFAVPEISEQLPDTPIDGRWLLKQFKNPKSFFEGEGKQRLRDELEKFVMEPITQYIQSASILIEQCYQVHLEQMQHKYQQNLIKQLNEYVEAELHLLADEGQIKHFFEAEKVLQTLLKKNDQNK